MTLAGYVHVLGRNDGSVETVQRFLQGNSPDARIGCREGIADRRYGVIEVGNDPLVIDIERHERHGQSLA